ncbi:MarR family transcriptional regulator [Nitrosopumilus sp.]|uniref:helix-turn-helix transcriptional regulator n=1 Tax=Nitrosopumilus sp. TaxID=2024843 RepID=UPI003B5944EC
MHQEIESLNTKIHSQVDGMLFVRTDGILETMVKTSLIVAGLIVVVLMMPIQTSFSSTRTLDLTLYADGSAHVSAQLDIDPLEPDFEVDLFGPSVDNFVAVGENGFLFSEIIEDKVRIDTIGSSSITIDYDIHDLISKEGRVWTFSFDSSTEYSLLMPPNSIIVGMNALPLNMELQDDQTKLELNPGLSEINYIFGNTNPPVTNPPVTNPPVTNPPVDPQQPTIEPYSAVLLAIPITTTIAIAIILIKRKQKNSLNIPSSNSNPKPESIPNDTINIENILDSRPDMREDDKEIVRFISQNGGEVLESDLRKKFLQPRTTMWRAVKRLERQGLIEITKKDLQNLVKIKIDTEDVEE